MKRWAKLVGAGVVDIGDLPKSHLVKDRTYTGLRKISDATLRSWGFYQYEDGAPPEFNASTHFLGSSLSFNGESVTKEYVVLEKNLETVKTAKLAELASARYAAEVAGIEVGGEIIRTDRASQAALTGASQAALARLLAGSLPEAVQSIIATIPATVDWKGGSSWLEGLTDEQIISAAVAVHAHVQTLFSQEKALQARVEAIEINETTTLAEALEAVDAIVWVLE